MIHRQPAAGAFCAVFSLFLSVSPTLRAGAPPSNDNYLDYFQGLQEERAGNFAKALESYERVLSRDPQAIDVLKDIATLQLRLGRADEALKAAEKARDLAPKDPESFIFIGNVHVAKGDLAKAADAYSAALALDPNNVNAIENLAHYYSIVDPDKAIPYYERYLELNPGAGDMWLQLGLVYQKRGRSAKALESFDRASAIDARQPAPHLAKAELYEAQASTAAAMSAYLRALSLEPENPQILMRVGQLQYRTGRWEEAQKSFQATRALIPREPSVYYWLARTAEERKDWASASTFAEQAYDISQDPQFLPLTAFYFTLNKELTKAIAWLERAHRADPKNPNTLLFLGINYLETGRPKEAHEALTKAVTLTPDDPQLYFHLGVAEDRLGQSEASESRFRRVLELDPKNAAAKNYLGYTWADRGVRLEEAERLLREAVQADPQNPAFLDSLGWARFKQGDLQEARSLLEKAAALDPDPLIQSHLAQVVAAKGDPVAGMRALARAAAQSPKDAGLRKQLDASVEKALPLVIPANLLAEVMKSLEEHRRSTCAVRLEIRWIGKPRQARGDMAYERPDRLRLTLGALGKIGPSVFRLEGNRLEIEPPESAERFGGFQADRARALVGLLSGDLLKPFQSAAGVRRGRDVTFKTSSGSLRVDAVRGVVTQWRGPDPGGDGEDEIQVNAHTFVDGVWVPREMRLRHTASGWEARLYFSDWQVNDDASAVP